MAKTFDKAVTGFNHNVKHKGSVFHVQTEDSGVNNPHIITHLFVGGNILASKKTSYADIAKAENLPDRVRELMEQQHKEMLRKLVSGAFDANEAAGAAKHYQPGQLATPEEMAQATLPGPAANPPSAGANAQQPPGTPAGQQSAVEAGNQPAVHTLFGEDLISDRSLDEVILSYLGSTSEG